MIFDTRVPLGAGKLEQDVFFIPLNFLNLGAAGSGADTATQSITADSDGDIEIAGMSRVVSNGVAPAAGDINVVAFPPLLVTLSMTSSGRILMPAAVHIENIAGSGQLPGAWPRPKIIRKSSTMKVTIQNLHTANAFNVRLMFHAFKIFY